MPNANARSKFYPVIFCAIFSIIALSSPLTAQKMSADLIVFNARVRTTDDLKPTAEAVAAADGKIVAVGTNSEIKSLAGANTKTVDAHGRLVLPGFNDAHVHFLESGFQLTSVDLRSAKSPAEFVRRIKDFAAKQPKGQWILGGNWDHENWTPNNLPTRELIDAATPDNPVFIYRLDGHMALANSLALKLAGVDANTKDVNGGEIVRAAAGEPTGILKDAAMDFVTKLIPDYSFAEKLQAAAAMSDSAASFGVTSIQNMTPGVDVGVFQELLRQNKLKTRVYLAAPLADWKNVSKIGFRAAFGSPMIRIGAMKGFADGSLGSTTAWFFEPYLDAPTTSGLAGAEIPAMYEEVSNADKAGLQVMIHAIGDKANDTILSIYERVAKENGGRDRRFRIEHAQHLRLRDIPRFGQDKIIASMQPYHLSDDGRWNGKRLDKERLKGAYAFRSLLDSGAMLAFGTDSPVAPINPLLGIYTAVTRRTLDGKNPNGWFPEQKITVAEAVRAYTIGSAYAEFQENVKGTIAVGKLADLVILSDDIFAINPVEIEKTRVLTTIVGGRIVYESQSEK
ncbi:MAG: amidohydrolase [Acidobacteriota bacterium]